MENGCVLKMPIIGVDPMRVGKVGESLGKWETGRLGKRGRAAARVARKQHFGTFRLRDTPRTPAGPVCTASQSTTLLALDDARVLTVYVP